MLKSIADIRKDYSLQSLSENDVAPDALEQFSKWWQEAVNSDITEVNAMTLATATKDGKPYARIVLLKGFDDNGFTFFTNYKSAKGYQLTENPKASLVFFWKELERQIRIQGNVFIVDKETSESYFNSRPAASRISAWASPQSSIIENREFLEEQFLKYNEKFSNEIPCPGNWGGYKVLPKAIEFWQGRKSRLHDRILYTRQENGWQIQRLAP